jgi:hypothetical protein
MIFFFIQGKICKHSFSSAKKHKAAERKKERKLVIGICNLHTGLLGYGNFSKFW